MFDPLCSNGLCQGTESHLPYYIFWWGYHSSDLDYGNMTRFWVLAEISFWVVSALVVVALVQWWRRREAQAFALLPGRRDMGSFSVTDPETGSTLRTLREVSVTPLSLDLTSRTSLAELEQLLKP